MRPGRMLLAMLLVAGGVAVSLVVLSHELGSLHTSLSNPTAGTLFSGPATTSSAPRPGRHGQHSRPQATNTRTAPAASTPNADTQHHHSGGVLSGLKPVLVAGIEIAAGLLLVGLLLLILVARRTRRRRRREYQLYELHLSAHDEAKPQDLEDMVESIANIIRVFPAERARRGQPYVALELICGQGRQGMEWSLNIRCEPRSVRALDGAIAARSGC